jgi:TetR/AcrR family transcriptional repressor of nem operon
MDLFWKQGFPSVSASALARAMSIQRSSLYNAFGGREAIFREALARYGAAAPDAPLDRYEPGEPAIPLLVGVFREACRARAADREARGCLACNSIGELVGVHDELGRLLKSAVRSRIRSVERLLIAAVAQGELPELRDVSAAAKSVVSFLIGLNTLSKVVRDEEALWAMSRSFLLGLGVPPDSLARSGG